jgi:signal transduction histidine kinase
MQAIIESVDAGVALIGPGGEVGMANGALTALTGGPVATREDLEAGLGTPLVQGEVHLPASGRWLRLAIDEIDESELVIVRDLTAEREAAAAQEAFMGVMSHELRTPVTTILGLAHLMGRAQGDSARTGEFAADIVGEAERMGALIEDLLILSRAQGGRVTVDPEPVLLQHAITAVIDIEAARHPAVAFAADVARDLPPAEGDRTLVAQVLRNMIGNAAKYSPTTNCTVSVVARATGQEVEVIVRDEGPGFEPGEEDRLFDIFYRSERTSRVRAGSGIGLYVSKTLVEAMHGRIWARLRPEGGAEFGFALPIVQGGDLD